MTLAGTYAKLLESLRAELAELDRDIARESERQAELVARRAEVVAGIVGIITELERTD